jgi:hypothetical protein
MKTRISLAIFLGLWFNVHAQKVIQLYEGKPKGSENWTWSEQTSSKNMFNTDIVYNLPNLPLPPIYPPKIWQQAQQLLSHQAELFIL